MDHPMGRLGRGAALAALYALSFWALRVSNITLDQWYLPAGLRVAALMLVPRRYWLYLIVGESAALLFMRFPKIDNYGIVFVVVSSITIMPLVAGLIRIAEGRHSFTDAPHKLLVLAIVVAVSTASANTLITLGLMKHVSGTQDWTSGFHYLIGDFLGILTFAPLVLLWRERSAAYPFPRRLRKDVAIAMGVTFLLFSAAASIDSGGEKNLLRMLMIVPATILTVFHGWRGAAAGVVMSNTALAMTIQRTTVDGNSDPDALIVQFVLAVAAIILLTLGTVISRYYRNATTLGLAEARAMEIARRSFGASEQELERRVADLQFVIDEVFSHLNDTSKWLRQRGHAEAALEAQNYRVINEQRIKDNIRLTYPTHVATSGLYAAIGSNMAAGKWGGHSKVTCALQGDDRLLGPELQLMVYRVLDDVVALLAITGHSHVFLRARCSRRGGRTGIAVSISVRDRFQPAIYDIGDLDASGRVLAFGGRLRQRERTIFLAMQDPRTRGSGAGDCITELPNSHGVG